MGKDVEILFEDNHLLIVVKPPGMLVQADRSGDADLVSYLRGYVKEHYNKSGNAFIGLVHRLDRNVGGVMVFAKTSKSASRLSEQLRSKDFQKLYLAVVEGEGLSAVGRLEGYLVKNRIENRVGVYKSEVEGSKYALLTFMKIGVNGNKSLLAIELQTGRSHQIRAQLADYGFPLVGDGKYGSSPASEIALWSYQISFKHPTLATQMTFTAYPDIVRSPWLDFKKTILAMQKEQKEYGKVQK